MCKEPRGSLGHLLARSPLQSVELSADVPAHAWRRFGPVSRTPCRRRTHGECLESETAGNASVYHGRLVRRSMAQGRRSVTIWIAHGRRTADGPRTVRIRGPSDPPDLKRAPSQADANAVSPTIGAAITANYWFLWVRCPACGTINAIDLRRLDRHPDAAVTSLIPALSCPLMPAERAVRRARAAVKDQHSGSNTRGVSVLEE
jgi:hypothetical protein